MTTPGGKRLILHVGLPKTGTSALQAWFRANVDALRAHGIDYPDAFLDRDDKHQFLIPELRQNALERLPLLLAAARCETIVLSSEGLSNHLYDFGGEALAAFRTVTADFETHILLLTRARLPWLRSYYKQCVINPKSDASELWGLALDFEGFCNHPRTRRLLDAPKLKHDLAVAFDAARVVHLEYEDDWFGAVKDHLGLANTEWPPLDCRNGSLPDWAVELFLQINRLGLPEPERRRWRAALQIHLETDHSVMRQSLGADWRRDLAMLDPAILAAVIAAMGAERGEAKWGGADDSAGRRLAAFADFVAANGPCVEM